MTFAVVGKIAVGVAVVTAAPTMVYVIPSVDCQNLTVRPPAPSSTSNVAATQRFVPDGNAARVVVDVAVNAVVPSGLQLHTNAPLVAMYRYQPRWLPVVFHRDTRT
jgi:hypothetical protein